MLNWLQPRLRAFREAFPEVGVTVRATIWITPRHANQPLVGRSLREEDLVMVCPRSFRHGPTPSGRPADPVRWPLIHVPGRQEHREAFAQYHGLTDLPLARGLTTDRSNVALEMAIAGLGFAITLASRAKVHLQRGHLVEPFPDRVASGWDCDLHPGE
ncbi:MAG: LysR substrate-binding domain-containing protein [Tabrizicola sp.]|uniref:LysR substrate-binding domain-containing protein n=1 Tax=Tabrizicola sp. TaxID=2005166 RepID=UPI002ABC69F7|nr:LysR substrate-binding domain-containing protein [Tabrizicola sp.]MDZ4086437.1 LysR substrate-binding domain-containing protein [Tabrizicola sp.]